MKTYIAALCLLSAPALADNSSIGLQLPSAGTSYGQDSIRSGDIDCKNAIGGATQLEFGVTGVIANYQGPFSSYDSSPRSNDIGLFARIVIPLDGPKERINCNSLYELELRRKRLEVLKLQEELEQLRQLSEEATQFEN
jgi:hypothetical protein